MTSTTGGSVPVIVTTVVPAVGPLFGVRPVASGVGTVCRDSCLGLFTPVAAVVTVLVA